VLTIELQHKDIATTKFIIVSSAGAKQTWRIAHRCNVARRERARSDGKRNDWCVECTWHSEPPLHSPTDRPSIGCLQADDL